VVPKLISKSVTGILILLVMGAMVWQVAPVSAGFTPTPLPIAPTATPIPPTVIPPTAKSPPAATPIPPTATPTATLPVLLPVAGGPASGLSHIEIIAVSLAGVLVLLLAAISLVIRKSARTKTDK
jgi:hypothetical protein